jgi:hypothetical protein
MNDSIQTNSRLDAYLEAVLLSELGPGERLLWAGQPGPGGLAKNTWPMALFAIPWTAFALTWVALALAGARALGHVLAYAFPLFGVPHLAIGFWMLSGPLRARARARRTVYAVTDRRALILDAGRTTIVESHDRAALGAITRRDRRDGTGDVLLSRTTWVDSDGDRRANEVGFFAIAGAREVERLLRAGASRLTPDGPRPA